MKTDKIEIRMTEVQKNIIRKLAERQNISMTNYVFRALFKELEKEGVILNFLNGEDIK